MRSEAARGSGRGRWPLGLAGMLGLVVMVEGALERRAIDHTPPISWSWKGADSLVRRESRRNRVLFFGDSQVKMGLLPEVVAARTGRPAYNLALLAGQAPTSYVMLRRALAAGARPEALVVSFEPYLLTEPLRINERHWPELLRPAECLDLAWTARDPDLFVATMLGRSLASLRARHEIRRAIDEAFRGQPPSLRPMVAMYARNWRVNRGAQVMVPNEEYRRGRVDTSGGPFHPKPWQRIPVHEVYVERFLTLAASRGIPVYWLIPPLLPEAQAPRDQVGATAAITRYIRGLQGRYPNVVVFDARRSGYPTTSFHDAIHLDRGGAMDLSLQVAERLRRDPDGPRWVELPPYRGRGRDLRIEDVVQSALALARGGGARR